MKLTGDKIIGIIMVSIPIGFVIRKSIILHGIMETIETIGTGIFISTFLIVGFYLLFDDSKKDKK